MKTFKAVLEKPNKKINKSCETTRSYLILHRGNAHLFVEHRVLGELLLAQRSLLFQLGRPERLDRVHRRLELLPSGLQLGGHLRIEALQFEQLLRHRCARRKCGRHCKSASGSEKVANWNAALLKRLWKACLSDALMVSKRIECLLLLLLMLIGVGARQRARGRKRAGLMQGRWRWNAVLRN